MENTMTPVISLKRIAFGKVTLELKTPGEWKILKTPYLNNVKITRPPFRALV